MENKVTDIFGLAPYGATLEKLTEAGISFLSKICSPASEELGFWFRDHIRYWRLKNVVKMLNKAEGMITLDENSDLRVHPRIMNQIIENVSWQDNDLIIEKWAGLLVSGLHNQEECSDDNLIFVKLLEQLTVSEVLLLEHVCKENTPILEENGLVVANPETGEEYSLDDLTRIMKISDIYLIDRALDHLISLSLLTQLESGFNPESAVLEAYVIPTALCLNLYVRTQGCNVDPATYWGLKNPEQ